MERLVILLGSRAGGDAFRVAIHHVNDGGPVELGATPGGLQTLAMKRA